MPECLFCKKEVGVNPSRVFVYVNINVGKPGKEKPLFLHINCFMKSIKKKSNLAKELRDSFWDIF